MPHALFKGSGWRFEVGDGCDLWVGLQVAEHGEDHVTATSGETDGRSDVSLVFGAVALAIRFASERGAGLAGHACAVGGAGEAGSAGEPGAVTELGVFPRQIVDGARASLSEGRC